MPRARRPAPRSRDAGNSAIAALVDLAAAAWPTIALPRQRFLEHLRGHVRAGRVELSSVRGDDLYLACACMAGDPQAVTAFDEQFRSEIEVLVQRWRLPRAQGDDVVQILWQKLLVADGGPPRIAEYSGRGRLRNWVRMAASRLLVDLARREQPGGAQPSDSTTELASLLEPGRDVLLAVMKANLVGHVRAAIEHALGQLSPRERNLLRYRFVHGLGIDEIARLHGLHRVSASRAITRRSARRSPSS